MTATNSDRLTLRIGHSPDPDDAFMWYPLANFPDASGPGGKTYTPTIDTGRYDFVHVLEDIQSLNDRCENAELEITALSIHQYPHVAGDYIMTSCGSSMGDGYGPMLVSPNVISPREMQGKRLAIPGLRTSAWLSFQLWLAEHGMSKDDVEAQVVMFDQIIPKVTSGDYDAGLIIHEGQLTYGDAGLQCSVDLGQWWKASRGLPLPLGGNAIRRDLGDDIRPITTVLLRSIEYALNHREASVAYALNYARDMGSDLADKFVGMYVNDWTLDYGDAGRQAVRQFIAEGVAAGLVPDCGEVDFAEPL